MSKHANEETPIVEQLKEMDEQELNAYTANALKRLAIRTAVGIAIGAAVGVTLSFLTSKISDSTDEDSSSTED